MVLSFEVFQMREGRAGCKGASMWFHVSLRVVVVPPHGGNTEETQLSCSKELRNYLFKRSQWRINFETVNTISTLNMI